MSLPLTFAKLSGIRKALVALIDENVSRARDNGQVLTRSNFPPDTIKHYFAQAVALLERLKAERPDMYADFHALTTTPDTKMGQAPGKDSVPDHFSREQALRLVRDIDQIFEIRANSELEQPKEEAPRRVFLSHGRSDDWRAVQAYIEKDVKVETIELAQEPSLGRTVIEKLESTAPRCDSAVIVMTGDDIVGAEEARVRENVMHETGWFQARYGRGRVVLLHEEGVNIPTNLSGIVYCPFPKGAIDACFHLLMRELSVIYKNP